MTAEIISMLVHFCIDMLPLFLLWSLASAHTD